MVVTAILFMASFMLVLSQYFRSSTSNCLKGRKNETSLPLGTLGWPLVGETMEFISCAYTDKPETFMDKRRGMYVTVCVCVFFV